MKMKCAAMVKSVIGRTSAKVFKDFKVGDIVEFSTEIASCGGSRGRSYAVDICVHNRTQDIMTYKTFNQISMPLNCFEWEELESVISEHIEPQGIERGKSL